MLISTLVLTGLYSTMVETLIADNDYRRKQALYLAEAGLRHAWAFMQSDGGSLDEYLVGADGQPGTDDDGALLGGSPVSMTTGTYQLTVVDNGDDGDPSSDADDTVFLVSVGAARSARVELRVTITAGGTTGLPVSYLFNNRLTVTGESNWYGGDAIIHSNDRIEVVKDATIEGNLQTSGQFIAEDGVTINGSAMTGSDLDTYVQDHRNLDPIDVPEVDPEDFRDWADYVMGADGGIRDGSGNLVFDASGGDVWNGWKYATDKWELKDSGTSYGRTPDATYFVEGNLIAGGHNGTEASPLAVTLVTTGHLEIGGHAWMSSYANDTLAVVGTDAEIHGHTDTFEFMGHVLVHEQLKLSGHVNVAGGILVEDAEDLDDMLTRIDEGTKIGGHTNFRIDPSMSNMPVGTGAGLLVANWYEGS
jgi:hypothetical protein